MVDHYIVLIRPRRSQLNQGPGCSPLLFALAVNVCQILVYADVFYFHVLEGCRGLAVREVGFGVWESQALLIQIISQELGRGTSLIAPEFKLRSSHEFMISRFILANVNIFIALHQHRLLFADRQLRSLQFSLLLILNFLYYIGYILTLYHNFLDILI